MTNFTASPAAAMGGLLEIADHATRQSDRWLFVALLVVALAAVAVIGKWLAGQYNRTLDTWREDMKAMQAEMKGLHQERLAAADRYAEELRHIVQTQTEDAKAMLRTYSETLARNAETMGAVNLALREMQTSCAIARAGWAFPRPGWAGGPAAPQAPSAG